MHKHQSRSIPVIEALPSVYSWWCQLGTRADVCTVRTINYVKSYVFHQIGPNDPTLLTAPAPPLAMAARSLTCAAARNSPAFCERGRSVQQI